MNNPRDNHLTSYRAGSHVAAYELVRYLGNVEVSSGERKRKTDLFACRCLRCGHECEIDGRSLRRAQQNGRCSCNNCKSIKTGEITPEKPKICSKCYDLPHRRPLVGPCRCGEIHEVEPLHVEQFASNGISNLGWAAIERRRHIAGVGDERSGAQHRGPYRVASDEYEAMT